MNINDVEIINYQQIEKQIKIIMQRPKAHSGKQINVSIHPMNCVI